MSAGTPWSVKGIDAKARSVAKELARRSGMTLGEWLNQMILEGRDVSAELAAGLDAPHEPVATRRPAPQSVSHQIEDDDFETPDYAPAARSRASERVTERTSALAARNADRRAQAARPEREPAREYDRDLRREALPQSAPSADIGHVANALEALGSRLENSETRSAHAVRGVSQAVEALLGRLERSEERVAQQERVITDQVEEVLTSVERLSRTEEDTALAIADRLSKTERRIEAQNERFEGLAGIVRADRERFDQFEAALEEVKSPEAIQVVEGALGSLANQLYEDKARAHASIADVRQDMVSLSHRLAQIELRDPQKDAQALIDQVVARMAQRLESAEARTQSSIRGLEQAFSSLDARLIKAERTSAAGTGNAQTLTQLAGDLSRRMDEARAEMLGAVERATLAKTASPAGLEDHLNAIAAQVASVEKRSARALEQMGQDVLRIAENLNRRVMGVERKSETMAERLAGEIDHLAARTEVRLESATTTHANALERLGGEIARISERLNAKISETEKRTGLMIGGVEERVSQNKTHLSGEIADRIKASEERTQKLLEDARAKIDARLEQASLASLQASVPKADAPVASSSGLPNPFSSFIDQLQPETSKPEILKTEARAIPEVVRRDRLTASLALEDTDASEISSRTAALRPISNQPFSNFPSVFEEGTSVAETPAPRTFAAERPDPFADPFDAPAEKPAAVSARRALDDDLDITGRLLSGLTDFTAPAAAPPKLNLGAGVVKDAFGETPADPFATLRDDEDDDVDFDGEFEAAPKSASADPFADDADEIDDIDVEDISQKGELSEPEAEDDPFADIDLARKTAPRAAKPVQEDIRAEGSAFDDIFDRDLDVPSPVEASAFDRSQAPIPELDSRARASTRDALMSARAAVQASIEGAGDNRKVGFGGKPKSSEARPTVTSKQGGSLLSRLIKTSTVSVLAVTVMLGAGLMVQNYLNPKNGGKIPGDATSGPIPGGREESLPYAAVLTEPQSANAGTTQEDKINDLYDRALTALKARDPAAVAKLQSVANLGHTTAQYYMGLIYDGKQPGYEARVSKKQARQWYERAADNGSVEAMYNLGLMYFGAEGGRRDYPQAANMFRRAADRGFRDAQYNLASLYLQGLGVGESASEAYKWFLIASQSGDTQAAERVRDLSSRLTDGQRALAESEAARFKPMNESPVIVAQN